MRKALFFLATLLLLVAAGDGRADVPVGVAQVDITPSYPVRLSGFGFRRTESEGVTQPIYARALAIGDDKSGPALLITTDNLGVPDTLVAELAARLKRKAGLARERLAVTATHTHTAPMLTGVAPTLFSLPIPAEHQKNIDRYTREFTDKLEEVALSALKDRKPAKLYYGVGKVTFAINRRTKGGPVDHDLPILVVKDAAGKVRAVYLSYACHCVTLSNNKVSGDWAGFAAEQVQRRVAGAVALVSVGCGADSNPSSGVAGDKAELARGQGEEIAKEVDRLLKTDLTPVTAPLVARLNRIELPFDTLPTRAEWEAKAKQAGAVGYHAKVNLARLDRGEALQTKIDYPIQTWAFGDQLAMVFLPGEVVVDYVLRLKKELDRPRLWVNAYANDAPCYIPSERVLKEGGYEGGGAMIYYDRPTKLKAGLEDRIVAEVKRQLGESFRSKTQGTRALSPAESLAALRPRPDMTADLAAAEPLVESPVAIDFGPDGRLWVVEMLDYPMGMDNKFKPGGRVKVLEDKDGDGKFDKSTVFLESLPFPTGLLVWRKGLLVCAAPDVLYAEDTDGDGKADKVRKLLTGFATHNYQARVNSLHYGLDGWVYASAGFFGGVIKNFAGKETTIVMRDFRFNPDTGDTEPVSGVTQQGRARDDRGNWFGCDNSNLLRHYPLVDHYLGRNRHVAPPSPIVNVPDYTDSHRLYPVASQLQLFKLSGAPGRVTAACGLGLYRDELLGADFTGDAFTCEPVSLVVHRLRLTPRGVTYSGRRADDEQDREFLASTDGWFRPVQVRTGPDGALWVVDMYRFLIEHPRWIPPEQLEGLDVRAGHDRGRIYRVYPKDGKPRPWQRLDRLDAAGLVAALDSPNGTQRDLAQQMLVWRGGREAVAPLRKLLAECKRATARLHALCTLDLLDGLTPEEVRACLKDTDASVRQHAVRLAEKRLDRSEAAVLAPLADDPDAQVRYQLAYTLGDFPGEKSAQALAKLALSGSDTYLTAAVLSSVHTDNVGTVLTAVLTADPSAPGRPALLQRLLAVATALGDRDVLARALRVAVVPKQGQSTEWQLAALADVLDALAARKETAEDVLDRQGQAQMARTLALARTLATKAEAPEATRLGALRLLARDKEKQQADRETLSELLTPQNSVALQAGAVAALGRMEDRAAAGVLLDRMSGLGPDLRSQAIDALLARRPWLSELFDRLEKGTLQPSALDAARRDRLLRHSDPAIRARAEKSLGGAVNKDRARVLEDYRASMTLTADPARGRQVYLKSCSACHRLEGQGFNVGPDLAALTNRSPEAMLIAVLDPNRALDARYVTYTAATRDGRTVTGLLAAETATSVTLRSQEGKETVVLRRDLEELASTGLSLMPEGMEKDLSRQDLADLLAYLARFEMPKKFRGNDPTLITPDPDGRLDLPATRCAIYGKEIVFEQEFKNIGYWHGEQDRVVWTIKLEKPGRYEVILDWACAPESAGNAYVLEGDTPLRGKVASTGGWDRYRREKIGTVSLKAGEQRLTFRPDGPVVRLALIDLRSLVLVPEGKADDSTADVARRLLDDTLPQATRQALVNQHPTLAADLVREMTRGLKEAKEEYRRIPWIWRVSIAAGKRNDAGQVTRLLEVSLPGKDEPLRHWQAVVIGGGIINGVSQAGAWPGERLAELLAGKADLAARWEQALEQSLTMADDEKVPTGTRYDALRMLGLGTWQKHGVRLAKYLGPDVHAELQMGAVSGLADMPVPEAGRALLAGLRHCTPANRKLALDALLRDPTRVALLLEAVEKKEVTREALGQERVQRLLRHDSAVLRTWARHVLVP